MAAALGPQPYGLRDLSISRRVLSGLKFGAFTLKARTNAWHWRCEQQLRAVGVEVVLEPLSTDEGLNRLTSGNFEAALIDVANGPLVRPYLVLAHERKVELRALQQQGGGCRASPDSARRRGCRVSKRESPPFSDAIFDDPPAIFLAWSERARAVSTRFEVQPSLAAISSPRCGCGGLLPINRPTAPTDHGQAPIQRHPGPTRADSRAGGGRAR